MEDVTERVINESSYADLELRNLKLVQEEINTALDSNPDDNKDSEAMNFMSAF